MAASPAAARESVAQVVSGRSLSTPESKATIGMPALFARCSCCSAARVSSAARPMAAGFLAIALVSIVTWASTSASVAGPSKVIVAPCFSASASAPFFTACQNWCWKPLEMMAM